MEVSRDAGGLRVRLSFLPGERGEVLIARSPRPTAVEAAGAKLEESERGFRHDAGLRLLDVRFVSASPEVEVRVEYP